MMPFAKTGDNMLVDNNLRQKGDLAPWRRRNDMRRRRGNQNVHGREGMRLDEKVNDVLRNEVR